MSASDTITESIKRYRDTGAQFTEDARDRAENVVVELRRSGEERSRAVSDFFRKRLEHGREVSEDLTEGLRRQLETGLGVFGIATRSELEELEKRLDAAERALERSGGKTATKPSASTRSKTKKASKAKSGGARTRQASAKKTSAKKTSAKKTSAKKSSAKKSSAKKSSAKKTS